MEETFDANSGKASEDQLLDTLGYGKVFQRGGSDPLLEATECTYGDHPTEATESTNDGNKTIDVCKGEGVIYKGRGRPEGVFSPDEVYSTEGPLTFFIAGRGGETNFHPGNQMIRKRILSHREEYTKLSPGERGKKMGLRLLRSSFFRDVRFVVRVSYFMKNQATRKISTTRIFSVISEHGKDKLGKLDGNDYVTVGVEWAQGIIVDLLRAQAPSKSALKRCEPGGFSAKPSPPKKRAVQTECGSPETPGLRTPSVAPAPLGNTAQRPVLPRHERPIPPADEGLVRRPVLRRHERHMPPADEGLIRRRWRHERHTPPPNEGLFSNASYDNLLARSLLSFSMSIFASKEDLNELDGVLCGSLSSATGSCSNFSS